MSSSKWYKEGYRRILVDSHIADWDPSFYSKFDPDKMVEIMAKANPSSVMLEAKCCVGNAYYPTKVGHIHAGIGDMDVFGELLRRFHARGIKVLASYITIQDNWVYDAHPDWRMVFAKGAAREKVVRYKELCPSTPYREYALAQTKELAAWYDIDGIFFDMNFYPDDICLCDYCRERYRKECGKEMPQEVNWENQSWVEFVEWRKKIIYDFTKLLTDGVREVNPHISVNNQVIPHYLYSWKTGQSLELHELADYMGIDATFFTETLPTLSKNVPLNQNILARLFYNLTRNRPYELHIAKSPGLSDHTGIKPLSKLKAQAFNVIANGGAILFIDAINPDGTLYPRVYETIGKVFSEIEKIEPYLGGEAISPVAVYTSEESSRHYEGRKGNIIEDWALDKVIHAQGFHGTCRALQNNHIPYGVITRKNLNGLDKYRLVILSNVVCMNDEEANKFTEFVANGGRLIATRMTSLMNTGGGRRPDFGLKDVLGVSYQSQTEEKTSYIANNGKVQALKDIDLDIPMMLENTQAIVKSCGAEEAGRIVLPYRNKQDKTKDFASIHSYPPHTATESPAVLFNDYGKGKACYISGVLETVNLDAQQKVFSDIVRFMLGDSLALEVDAPKCVVCTAFSQPEKKRIVIHLVNHQEENPPIPVHNVRIKLQLDSEQVSKTLTVQPDNEKLKFKADTNSVEFTVPTLEIYRLLVLGYE